MVVSTTDPEAAEAAQPGDRVAHDQPSRTTARSATRGASASCRTYTIAGGHGRPPLPGEKAHPSEPVPGRGHRARDEPLHPVLPLRPLLSGLRRRHRLRRHRAAPGGSTSAGSRDGALESPFSGNLVDICPTGVFTDKTARFRARYWDYQFAPSICPHCSLGCNTAPQPATGNCSRSWPRRNDQVNGWFICDRGRFDKHSVNDRMRPRIPLIDGRETRLGRGARCGGQPPRRVDQPARRGSVAAGRARRGSRWKACVMLARLAELLGSASTLLLDR